MATRYQELEITNNCCWLDELELGLGVWEGDFQAATGQWLRWYDASDHWILTSAELAEQEKDRADQATQRAEQEKQWAERLAEQLRSLGIDPE